MDELQELVEILRQVGPENIWRPVYSPGNKLLADGVGNFCNGLPKNLEQFDFKDKTVADIGCNFGYYTFIVKAAGARHVTGVDADSRIIAGCMILKRLFGVDGVSFLATDIADPNGIGTFHTGMMIDFIGKTMVRTGVFKGYLNALERLSEKEMILSLRPAYNVKKHLNGDFRLLEEKYPGDYIRDNSFFTIDYIRDRFRKDWHMEIVSPKNRSEGADKQILHFIRKHPGGSRGEERLFVK